MDPSNASLPGNRQYLPQNAYLYRCGYRTKQDVSVNIIHVYLGMLATAEISNADGELALTPDALALLDSIQWRLVA